MTYIAADLDGFDAWIASGIDALGDYLAKWAELERRHGA